MATAIAQYRHSSPATKKTAIAATPEHHRRPQIRHDDGEEHEPDRQRRRHQRVPRIVDGAPAPGHEERQKDHQRRLGQFGRLQRRPARCAASDGGRR